MTEWTVKTLYQLHKLDTANADRRLADLTVMLDERYQTQMKALDAALTAQQKALDTAQTSAEKAVLKAEAASEKRFEAVNEFRQVLTDQTATFMSRDEVGVRLDAMAASIERNSNRINEIQLEFTSRLDRQQGSQEGVHASRVSRRLDVTTIFQVLATLGAIIGVIIVAFHP